MGMSSGSKFKTDIPGSKKPEHQSLLPEKGIKKTEEKVGKKRGFLGKRWDNIKSIGRGIKRAYQAMSKKEVLYHLAAAVFVVSAIFTGGATLLVAAAITAAVGIKRIRSKAKTEGKFDKRAKGELDHNAIKRRINVLEGNVLGLTPEEAADTKLNKSTRNRRIKVLRERLIKLSRGVFK